MNFRQSVSPSPVPSAFFSAVPTEHRDFADAEPHARRHLKQVPKRRAPVLGASERDYIRGDRVVHRADVAFSDSDADEHRRHGLGHRLRGEAMPIVPSALITLDKDRVTARDEESGDGIARKVVVECERFGPINVVENGFARCAREQLRMGGSMVRSLTTSSSSRSSRTTRT
jgi:hypothetical protein